MAALRSPADELWLQGVRELLEGREARKAAGEAAGPLKICGLEGLQASLKADPANADRHYFLGGLHLVLGQTDAAEECWEAAVAEDPADPDAYLELVLLHERAQELRRAWLVAEQAVTAGARWQDPWQRPPIFVPGLTSRPFWDRSDFAWSGALEDAYPEIRAEVEAFLAAGTAGGAAAQALGESVPESWVRVGDAAHATHDGAIVAPGGEWREYVLFGAEAAPCDPSAPSLPFTRRLLQQELPGALAMASLGAGEVILSALAPGTRLTPHCAMSNNRLTCHLGIACPEGARIRVGEGWSTWEEGKCLFFDDSYEHEVVHEGATARIVLLIRFFHPELPQERWLPCLEGGCADFERLRRRRSLPPLPAAAAPLPPEVAEPLERYAVALGFSSGGGEAS